MRKVASFFHQQHPGRLNPQLHLWELGNQIYRGDREALPSLTLRYAQIGSDGYKPENRDILSGFSESHFCPAKVQGQGTSLLPRFCVEATKKATSWKTFTKTPTFHQKKRSFFHLQVYNIYKQTFTEIEWRTNPPPNSNHGKT